MIVILEGLNGVGKSTYAKLLSERLDAPIIRPFRGDDTDLHWGIGKKGKERFEQMKELKVPVNSHVDDMYLADFLATYPVSAVMDRALPSAIAYGDQRGDYDGWYGQPHVARRLIETWMSFTPRWKGPALYVWMRAPYHVMKERCYGRWCPTSKQTAKMEKWFEKSFQAVTIDKRQINTSEVEIEDGVNSIVNRLLDAVDIQLV